ncbi:MAG: NAD(P)H-hydrate dehydratase [Treponema sp.]|nr:NAD(P)H-hydrate dehydratase [Treponema sp.]
MQNIYGDTRILDSKVRELYKLSEDIMMENAAAALEDAVASSLKERIEGCSSVFLSRPAVLILAGSGNNGADGYALARRLISHEYAVTVCAVSEPKSPMCILQKERAAAIGVSFIDVSEYDDYIERVSIDLKVIVDCIFGSGFHGELPFEAQAVIASANKSIDAVRIACDVPSGLDCLGNVSGSNGGSYFCADKTVTMGALKMSLFSDVAKDACGTISLAGLGVSRGNFEYADGTVRHEACLLEKSDSKLPLRKSHNVNKGTFGHAAIVCGTKPGASVIAGSAALRFGAGLVTLVSDKADSLGTMNIPFELMTSSAFPANAASVALGMGLGSDGKSYLGWLCEHPDVPAVLDADICHSPFVKDLLEKRSSGIVLTPHPKEFSSLLEQCGMGTFSVKEVVARRVELVKAFCNKYPDAVLLLKGANVLIGIKRASQNDAALYINPFGSNALAKGGSGDVLSGLVAALLAQKYEPLQAAVYASLAHTSAAEAALSSVKNNFAITPIDLIQAVKAL